MLDSPDDAVHARGGARRAAKSSRIPRRRPPGVPRGGARARRMPRERRRRRARGLGGTLGLTVLGALVPGSGYLYAGRRAVGAAVLLVWVGTLGATGWYFARDVRAALDLAFDPTLLKVAAGVLGLVLGVWAFVVVTSYRLVRPRERKRWHTAVGYAMVLLLVGAGTAPIAKAAQYALVTADTVEAVFKDDVASATIPDAATEEDPWAGQPRVNVLLLGGDGGEGRDGVRTDTVILVSMDTVTGKTVMFSLPRNMMYAQFPDDSPLHEIYPEGYGVGSSEDPAFYMLNAVYGQVPARYPGILGESDNEGADAIKQAVEGSLGVPVDYYLLVNLAGFREVVDAIGGITVNINEPVAINGNTDAGIPPTGYLQPGPDQHLDGFHALWFARGRYGSDDYARMDRQRCAVNALIDAADPTTMLTRYVDLARAGKEIVYTDIPRDLGPAFVELLLKVKDAKLRSVVFRSSDKFFSGDPDYDYLRSVVQKAIYPAPRPPGQPRPPRAEEEEDPVDVCAYRPEGSETTDDDGTLAASD